ncbi:MAG: hypothetical protein IPI67_11205 [Myxococcales bacterium]|nr:hypothetical protein [Myxococcales bacterium]
MAWEASAAAYMLGIDMTSSVPTRRYSALFGLCSGAGVPRDLRVARSNGHEAGEQLGLSLRRCDVPKGAGRRCGAWGEPGGLVVLD